MNRINPEINAGSMADIAFLLLIFFLVTTTMDVDKGLQRRLPPMPSEENQQNAKVNRRNIMQVKLNSQDRIMAGGSPIDISQLRDKVVEFITNPSDSKDLPEKEVTQIDGFGAYPVSKGVISLQNDRGTSYSSYIKVQNELVRAFDELRDQFAMANFHKKYAGLDEDKQKIVRKAVPQSISEAEPVDVTKK
ncbi:MAG: biopolymer transporter ExbD [Bacteroidales bacterium]|jgi:biopolymer transport protein ExbD|nr:biopolymer transporter ExbD [Bacteroidales bacterium]